MTGTLFQPGQVINNYQIVRFIGRGGMAEVYHALQTHPLQREVALKVLLAGLTTHDSHERFKREAEILANLGEHPHILRVYDYGTDPYHYIIMPLVNGGTLEDLIHDKEQFTLAEAYTLLEKICDALDYAHGKGVIHRDLKPSNILVDTRGIPYITDFGIAKMVDDDVTKRTLTQNGLLLGTPAYMSPEQLQSRPVDARTDIYALGIIIFEMLSGQLPEGGDTPYGYIQKCREEIDIESELRPIAGAEIAHVLQKAIALSPDDRYASVAELFKAFAEEVTAIHSQATLSKRPPNLKASASAQRETNTTPAPRSQKTVTDMPSSQPAPGVIENKTGTGEYEIPISLSRINRKRHDPDKVIQIDATPSQRPTYPAERGSARSATKIPEPTLANISRKFRLRPGAKPVPPRVCPVCLRQAHVQINIRHRNSMQHQPILFCEDCAKDYNHVGLAFILGHLVFWLIIGGAYIMLGLPGLLMGGVFYVVSLDFLSKLRGPKTREARKAVSVTVVKGNLQFTTRHTRYSRAFQMENYDLIQR